MVLLQELNVLERSIMSPTRSMTRPSSGRRTSGGGGGARKSIDYSSPFTAGAAPGQPHKKPIMAGLDSCDAAPLTKGQAASDAAP